MKKTLVIGYGNTLRGDDGAGVRAAELIAERNPEVDCVCAHQLTPELAEKIAEYDAVFFLDADVNATELKARLISLGVEAEQPRTHFTSPASLISLALQLYNRVPEKAYTIGIPASRMDFSEELSIHTTEAVRECEAFVISNIK
jgi:hydrogenase maturation protease